MTRLRGIDYDAGKALFEVGDQFVVVDINKRDVDQISSELEAVTADGMLKVGPTLEYPSVWKELAEAAVTKLDVQETVPQSERTFKIPNAVKVEAQQALDWVSGFNRGKSAIGTVFAKRIINETHLTTSDIARLDRYFNRISPRELSNGWAPGQQGYPTDDRIRFAMRGGEAGRAWVSKIVARHGVTAAGEIDGDKPHEYQDDPDIPGSCVVCGRGQEASVHTAVVASAFEYDDTAEYFGHGLDPDETLVDGLLMLRPDDTWHKRENGLWVETQAPSEDEVIIMLDEDSAYKLAEIIDDVLPNDPQALPFELAMLNPHEAALFALAEPEEDWEFVDRVTSMFDVYDSTERSINAKKQLRGPGGKFGDSPDSGDEDKPAQSKARLPQALPLVPDIAARIAEYLAANAAPETAPAQDEATPVQETSISTEYLNALIEQYSGTAIDYPKDLAEGDAAQPAAGANTPRPLYLAIVDSVDTEAVLDLVSLMPGNPPVMWKRDGGAWVQAPEVLAALQGTTPPPVVELSDDAIVADVIKQIDESTQGSSEEQDQAAPAPGATEQAPNGATGAKPDANPDQHPVAASVFGDVSEKTREKLAKKGYALPDGSFPIPDIEHLKKAVQAYGRAKNKSAAKEHIMKRARALKRVDLIPSDWKSENSQNELTLWGPRGELLDLTEFAGGLDRNRGNAEELRKYWTRGKGALKIRWNTPGDMTRCMRLLRKYLKGREAGYCALRHREMTGMWPGDRKNRDD